MVFYRVNGSFISAVIAPGKYGRLSNAVFVWCVHLVSVLVCKPLARMSSDRVPSRKAKRVFTTCTWKGALKNTGFSRIEVLGKLFFPSICLYFSYFGQGI